VSIRGEGGGERPVKNGEGEGEVPRTLTQKKKGNMRCSFRKEGKKGEDRRPVALFAAGKERRGRHLSKKGELYRL